MPRSNSGSQEKKESKDVFQSRSRLIDNPLFQSTFDRPWIPPQAPAAPVEEGKDAAVHEEHKDLEKVQETVLPEEHKEEVADMVSDLHKQLSATFSIDDSRQEELALFKRQVGKAKEKIYVLDAKLQELKEMLAAEEEADSEIPFLESKRLKMAGMARLFEEMTAQKNVERKDLEEKIEQLSRELSEKDSCIDQMEKLNEELSETLAATQAELDNVKAQRDRSTSELERVKAGVEEIRLMLAGRWSKAKNG